jgi:signal transduction histidine kinase/CheY-like chemotaxis protein
VANTSDEELRAIRHELDAANERLESLLSTSLEHLLCLEYDPPIPIDLPVDEQAELMLERAIIVSCNAVGASPFGVSARDARGKRLVDLAGGARDKALEAMRSFVRDGYRQERHEFAHKHAGGMMFVEINRTGTIVDRCLVRSWSVGRDITDRKRQESAAREYEAQLERSRKVESLGLLAGGMAHDFNNVLTVIASNLELARRRDPAEAANALTAVDHAVAHAQALVQQILTFSRRRESPRSVVRLQDVVAESVSLVRASLPAGVSLDVDDAAVCREVLADGTQVRQVVMNLLSNAAHAVGERGKIRVTLGEATKGTRVFAKLRVEDTGVGMDARTRAQIFDPFFTTKREKEGTGLGLSVVHGIVASHGGTIAVESAPGEGAIFDVLLPVNETSKTESPFAPAASRAENETPSARVLFVDDEPRLADIARRMLAPLGYCVTTSSSGTEALEAFRATPARFDVVVTDHSMPGMSGIDLATQIATLKPGFPVILISGYADGLPQEVLRTAGVSALVAKPFTMSALAEQIAATIER